MADVTIDDTELEQLRERAAAADSAAAAAVQAGEAADAARADLTAGVELYRATLAEAHHLQPEHLPGATFADVADAAQRARAIADAAIAGHTPAGAAPVVIPAGGASTRDDPPDTAGMTPHQMVTAGLAQRARK